jgi:hypothetical protein
MRKGLNSQAVLEFMVSGSISVFLKLFPYDLWYFVRMDVHLFQIGTHYFKDNETRDSGLLKSIILIL